jgi:hypothetical protein
MALCCSAQAAKTRFIHETGLGSLGADELEAVLQPFDPCVEALICLRISPDEHDLPTRLFLAIIPPEEVGAGRNRRAGSIVAVPLDDR